MRTKTSNTTRKDSRLNLYIEPELKKRLKKWAKLEDRSVNWLVNFILGVAVKQKSDLGQ